MASEKKNGGGDSNDEAPLIDLNDASIKKLIAKGKRRGYVTYDELNDALPQSEMSSDQIEDIQAAISEMGVQIVESDEDAEKDEDDNNVDEVAAEDEDGRNVPESPKKSTTTERTDDPVRMYLREMGAVELLSREGEIAIAKRIEAGRDTMILGLCESPITFNAIIDWSTALNEGTMQLREILDLDAMLNKDPAPESLTEDGEEDNGEISEKTAGPSFKEEEEPEEQSADDPELRQHLQHDVVRVQLDLVEPREAGGPDPDDRVLAERVPRDLPQLEAAVALRSGAARPVDHRACRPERRQMTPGSPS